MERRPYTFDRVVRLIITIVLFCAAVWLIYYLSEVLLPFFVAILIAYILEPFVQYNRRIMGLKGRGVAIAMTLFEVTFLFISFLMIFVPQFLGEMHNVAEIFNNYANSVASTQFLPDEVHHFIKRNIDFKAIGAKLLEQEWMSIVESTLTTSWGVITGSLSILLSILNWMLTLLYVVFIMIDYERFERGMRKMVPNRYKKVVFTITHDVKVSMNQYFRGQSLVAFCVGVLFAIGFSIVGIPMAVALGLVIGVMNMVPYLQLISIVPTALLCLVYSAGGGGDFWVIFGECFLVYCVVQAIQDLYLTPKIMGHAMGLNPALILLSLSVWGALLGFIGLIIALPLTTLLISYYNRYILDVDKPVLSDFEDRME